MYHKPVMLDESIESLCTNENGVYVDLTYGGGGHSNSILNFLGQNGKLVAFDQDSDAISNKADDKRLLLINQNFKHLKQNLNYYGHKEVDGVLADLGVSSFQFDQPERGFSIRYDSDLDMRMNKNADLKASDILNNYLESDLARVFFDFADLRNSRAIAKHIVEFRSENQIKTTKQLNNLLSSFLPKGYENKILAKIYQSLRIEVNSEIDALKEMLSQLPDVVKKGGTIVLITYHSIEDRLVKRFIQNGCFESEPIKDDFGKTNLPFKKLFKFKVPSNREVKLNNRARSAKLRTAIRL
jgi:16S rRNA (cytosine1402-N4)-methyltransferase